MSMISIDSKRVHRLMGYGLVLLAGFILAKLVMTAHLEAAAINEYTTHLNTANEVYESELMR